MKKLILGAALAAVSSTLLLTPAYAQSDCQKSWNVYDLNHDGYLKGQEAIKFRDDMALKGITVGGSKGSAISAKQYANACTSSFWDRISEDTP